MAMVFFWAVPIFQTKQKVHSMSSNCGAIPLSPHNSFHSKSGSFCPYVGFVDLRMVFSISVSFLSKMEVSFILMLVFDFGG